MKNPRPHLEDEGILCLAVPPPFAAALARSDLTRFADAHSMSSEPPRVNGRVPKSGYPTRARGSPHGSGLSSARPTTALAACAPLSVR